MDSAVCNSLRANAFEKGMKRLFLLYFAAIGKFKVKSYFRLGKETVLKKYEFKPAVVGLKQLTLCRILSVAEGLDKYIHTISKVSEVLLPKENSLE